MLGGFATWSDMVLVRCRRGLGEGRENELRNMALPAPCELAACRHSADTPASSVGGVVCGAHVVLFGIEFC